MTHHLLDTWNLLTDEISKQKVALEILAKCLTVRGGKDYLSYFFEEYDVSM